MSDNKIDNGNLEAKLMIRQQAIDWAPPHPRVLDCFAGEGHMYKMIWRDVCSSYLGFDKRFSRSGASKDGECWRGDNERLIVNGMRRSWDIVDLDAYSNPWPLLRKVAKLSHVDDIVVTATCGLDRSIRSGNSDFACAVVGASRLTSTSLLIRWYDDVIRRAMVWAVSDTRFRITECRRMQGIHNYQMRYYAIQLTRRPEAP